MIVWCTVWADSLCWLYCTQVYCAAATNPRQAYYLSYYRSRCFVNPGCCEESECPVRCLVVIKPTGAFILSGFSRKVVLKCRTSIRNQYFFFFTSTPLLHIFNYMYSSILTENEMVKNCTMGPYGRNKVFNKKFLPCYIFTFEGLQNVCTVTTIVWGVSFTM